MLVLCYTRRWNGEHLGVRCLSREALYIDQDKLLSRSPVVVERSGRITLLQNHLKPHICCLYEQQFCKS